MLISRIEPFLVQHGRTVRRTFQKFPALFLSTTGVSGKVSKKKVSKDKPVVVSATQMVSNGTAKEEPVIAPQVLEETSKETALTWTDCEREILENKSILVFSKSYCSFCRDVIDRLEDADLPFKEIALDLRVGGDLELVAAIAGNLKSLTGQPYVPYVYLGKDFMDSEKFLTGIRRQASLDSKNPPLYDELLSKGLIARGYFRT